MFTSSFTAFITRSMLFCALALGGLQAHASTDTPNFKYFEKQKTYIAEASNRTGISMELITAIGKKESGLGQNRVNRRSGTRGVMQFKAATWKDSLKRHHRNLGLSANASVMNDRANILVGAAALADNKALIEKAIGRSPNNGELYMSHLLGVYGAINVLKGKPNAPITKYVKLYRGNYSLTHKKGRVLTVSQFRTSMSNLMKTESGQYQTALNQARLDYVMMAITMNDTFPSTRLQG